MYLFICGHRHSSRRRERIIGLGQNRSIFNSLKYHYSREIINERWKKKHKNI